MKAYTLITGASAGIGRALARVFARHQHNLILVARRRDALESLAKELSETQGVRVETVPCDLGDPRERARLRETCAEWEVEGLVNNAGFGSNGPFIELDVERESAMVELNIQALVHLTGMFVPPMVTRGRGHVLNIGSTAGFQPGPFMATYYASKAFVNSFTEALGYELRGSHVSVTLSCPGPVDTEFAAIAGNDKSALFKRAGSVATAETIAEEAYKAMKKGSRRVIHGLQNQLSAGVAGTMPSGISMAIAGTLNRPPK